MLSVTSPIWSIGFRPFFLIGSLCAPLLMLRWVLGYSGIWPLHSSVSPLTWHAHEMIFGFTLAYVFGFLLTASANWANLSPVKGKKLIVVSLSFLMARTLSVASGGLTLFLFSVFDLLASALVLVFIYPYLSVARKNLGIFVVLCLLFILNLVFHLQQHGVLLFGLDANRAALHLLLLVVVLISGRVVPFFVSRRLSVTKKEEPKYLKILAFLTVVFVGLLDLLDPSPSFVISGGLLAFVVHSMRLWRWYLPRIWSEPMLWVLFIAYAWLPVGYLLFGLSGDALVTEYTALHAWTAGAISTMIIGIASRVSLGHSGRPIVASPMLIFAFGALTVGALLRVFGILVLPHHYVSLILISGMLWAFAFLLLTGMYLRIWLTPRL